MSGVRARSGAATADPLIQQAYVRRRRLRKTANSSRGHPGPYGARPPDVLLAPSRLCAHYFACGAWLDEGELPANAHHLAGIPGVLIQGRMDTGGLDTACELA